MQISAKKKKTKQIEKQRKLMKRVPCDMVQVQKMMIVREWHIIKVVYNIK